MLIYVNNNPKFCTDIETENWEFIKSINSRFFYWWPLICFAVVCLWNIGCWPMASIGLFWIHDSGSSIQFCISWFTTSCCWLHNFRCRLLRLLRRLVSIKMHVNYGQYSLFLHAMLALTATLFLTKQIIKLECAYN